MKAGPSLNFPPPGVPPYRPNGPGVGSSPTRLASMYHAAAGSQASPATPPAPAFMGFCATAVATCALGTRLWWLQLLPWNQTLHKKFLTRTLGPSMSLMRMGLQGLYRLAQKGQTRCVGIIATIRRLGSGHLFQWIVLSNKLLDFQKFIALKETINYSRINFGIYKFNFGRIDSCKVAKKVSQLQIVKQTFYWKSSNLGANEQSYQ